MGTFQAFRMAALGGARAVGLQDKTGLVEAGRSADLVLFDLANSLSILPRTDILGYCFHLTPAELLPQHTRMTLTTHTHSRHTTHDTRHTTHA